MSANRPRFSRFDVIVWLTLLALAGAIGSFLWRGDRVGVQILEVYPAGNAAQVSTKARVSVLFSEEITGTADVFSLTPPVSGTVRFQGRWLEFDPDVPLQPDTVYTASLAARLTSVNGRSLPAPFNWSFRTAAPHVLYVAGGEQDYLQLFKTPLVGGAPTQLTTEPYGIWDFALSPDGTVIVYAAAAANEQKDLWLIRPDGSDRRRLLDCEENSDCTAAVWSPDGKRLIYERRDLVMGASSLVPARLWWYDLVSGQTAPVFQEKERVGHSASWSADGRWLSYISPLKEGLQIYDIETGDDYVIPGEVQDAAAWSPTEPVLIVTKARVSSNGYGAGLLRADMRSGSYTELNGESDASDTSPAWSPDGQWVAFRRSTLTGPGGQLWLMRADGSESRPLTGDPQYENASPAWSSDGRLIVYQRFSLDEVYTAPEIWLLNLETNENRQVIKPGAWPVYLP